MARNSTEQAVISGINDGGKGRPYENAMSEAMAAYCVRNGIPYRTVTGTEEDKFRGTDFRVYGMLDIWTSNAGILRLDFTSAFSHKNNMPLLWMPMDHAEQLKGHPFQYGIRTGNETQGFDEPVIVVGIDASNNEDPDKDVDVALMAKLITENTLKNAPTVLHECGQALAAYAYASELRYRTWLDQQIQDGDGTLWQPDDTGLTPNYTATAESLSTRRPSYVTANGIRTAQEIAIRQAMDLPEDDPERKGIMAFWKKLDKLNQPKAAKVAPPSMSWMEQLNHALEKMDQDDKEPKPDGLTK